MTIPLHMVLTLTYPYVDVEIIELPVFKPNDYLYANFKSLGNDNVEIYTEAMRLCMSEISGLPVDNSSFEDKLKYISLIKGKEIKNT
jgi:hypothetical protein